MQDEMEQARVLSEWLSLLGQVITAIKRNHDKSLLVLETDVGSVVFLSAVGDCCSNSWFEHLTGVSALIGERVLRVVERDMPEGADVDGSYIRYYGWTLETAKGRCDLEMRNSSNGYYGGSVIVDAEPLDQYYDRREDAAKASFPVGEDF